MGKAKTRFFLNLKTQAVWDIQDGEQADYLAANTKDYKEVSEKEKLAFEAELKERDGIVEPKVEKK